MGFEGPYVLCPHSMSGLEAVLWAQKYPDEVEAIVGLDMPTVPMLLFVSDGSGGTGFDKETLRGFTNHFAESIENETIVELDCGHYVHDFEYERISKDMKEFFEGLGK